MPRVVHENAPHRPRADGKEVTAILPVDSCFRGELHVRFVHERRGAQGVRWPSACELPPGNPSEVIVNERHHLVERLPVAAVMAV